MKKRFNVFLRVLIFHYIFLLYPIKSQTALDHFPLDLDNQWIFSHTFYDTLSETIVDTQSIGPDLYYQFDQFREDQNVLFTQVGQRVLRYVDSQNSVWYDFGVDTGTSWIALGLNSVQWTVTLLGKNDTVVTPAGTWTNCFRFSFTGPPDLEWEEWFASGVGIVRRNLYGIALSEWLLIDKSISSITYKNNSSKIEGFSLYQNYPNPFNPTTTVAFDLPRGGRITLKILNIQGEEVVTLLSTYLPAGSHSIKWNASNAASGVYLYRLQAENFIAMRKMVLIR